MEKSAILIKLFGIVQGVGFRIYAQRKAAQMGVTGYVKNMPDGSVEVYGEAEKDVLTSFLKEMKKGPLGADVEDFKVSWKKPSGKYSDFRITY